MGHRGTHRPGYYYFSYGKESKIINSEQVFVPRRIISVIKTVEFVCVFFYVGLQPNDIHGLLIPEVPKSHTTT